MAVLLLEVGAYQLSSKYLPKKGNVWYFRRRIPSDVRLAYPGRPDHMSFALKTSDPLVAARSANPCAGEQDALWGTVRSGVPVSSPHARAAAMGILKAFNLEPGQNEIYVKNDLQPDDFIMELSPQSGGEDGRIVLDALPTQHRIAADLFYGTQQTPTFGDVKHKHFELGKGPKAERMLAQFDSAYNQFLKLSGDQPIDLYRRADANLFVAALQKRGCAPMTIKRYVAQISPIFGTGIREFDLQIRKIRSQSAGLTAVGKEAGEAELRRS